MAVCLVSKPAYAMEMSDDGTEATLTLYGDVCQTHPTDWWGEPIEGDFICQDEFLDDLKNMNGAENITIRINSLGGDASVGLLIHNRLRELARDGVRVSGIVDGVAMSAGSVILAACDHVSVNPSSLIMIHRAASVLWGYYNKDELETEAAALGAWDKAMVACYQRKTGLSETVLNHMISDTTYMAGQEAVEKGFADELLEEAEPLDIAASADGRSLFIRGRQFHLAPGMFAPDSIPTVDQPAPKTREKEEGGSSMNEAQTQDSIKAERKRIQEIDAIASLYDSALVEEAKYGETACTAQELAYRGAQAAVQRGQKFLANLETDAADSGVQDVPSASDPGDPPPTEKMTPEQRKADAHAKVRLVLGKEDEKK